MAVPGAVRLVRPHSLAADPPGPLDDVQARAVASRRASGPLVVMGGPGTGKTTTLVELVVARVERDGVAPDGVLVLASSRSAAAGLRERISARLARTVREPLARTAPSYAFGLLRRARILDGDAPPRLISGAEQDQMLAELLAGYDRGAAPGPAWPAAIGPEVRALRGFRDELRDLVMRAMERGLGPGELAAWGRRAARPEWVAAAQLLGEYLDVTALATPGAYDPAGIVDAAAGLLETDPDLLAAERDRLELVAVDDGQELTAASQRLLDLLVGGGRDLVITGDPDAACQTFRGARPQALGEAAHRWPRVDGHPAPVLILPVSYRQPGALRAVTARAAARIGTAGAGRQRAARPCGPGGTAQVHLLASTAQEAAFVAGQLRRAHVEDGVDWGAMAVVVRSARGTEPLRRALATVGVPVAAPAAEVPVRDEPAVVPLRLALACALDPDQLTSEVAADLLTGPIGGLDAVALRRVRRQLRVQELASGGTRSSDALMAAALHEPGTLLLLDERAARGVHRVAAVLDAGRAAAAEPGATGQSVLWRLWETTDLATAWRRTALAGGSAGAKADRDLDAVVALFEAAARYAERMPHAGPAAFLAQLEGQDVPADTLAERAPDDSCVALVTVAAAAGRQWDVVAVVGVQEGAWPDLRLRSSLLGAGTLADLVDGRGTDLPSSGSGTSAAAHAAAIAAARRAVLDDELRLFLVAVSRARVQLMVTAVRSEDELPSPFLDLVAAPAEDGELRALTEVPRAVTLPALVAELRATLVDPQTTEPVRRSAAEHLAALAEAEVPGAHPDDWFGVAELSDPGPLRGPEDPVTVSPSKVEQFDRCALRWLLEGAGGTTPSSSAQGLGILIHEIAEELPDGDHEQLAAVLAERIDRLALGAGWVGDQERQRAEAMIRKLAEYVGGNGRDLVATEQEVRVQVGRAVIRGTVDRLERDPEGRLVVVDLKTGKTPPARAELDQNPQLGVYQVTVVEGGFAGVAPGCHEVAGALLVQLGGSTRGVGVQAQPPLDAAENPRWAHDLVERVAEGMAGASFPASGNPHCRTCGVRRCCPLRPEGRQVGE